MHGGFTPLVVMGGTPVCKGLGFRFVQGKDEPLPNPVGLDGYFEGFCPPYFKTMGDAVEAAVMMGGLLEALLLARINREMDKRPIFTAKHAPKERGGKPKPLSEWMLKEFIDVVHEVGWITISAKDVGAVLRDYRNYIHPQKQLSHAVPLQLNDAKLFWEISKSIARSVIESAK